MTAASNDTTPVQRGQGHAVLRVERDRNFKTINLAATEDPRLSWRAKGIHTYLVSRPDGWTFRVQDLVKRSKDGRDAVYAALRELEKYGYLRREQPRGDRNRLAAVEWYIREVSSASWVSVSGDSVSGESATSIEGLEEEEINTDSADVSEAGSELAQIREVFEDWQAVTGRKRHRLTDPHKTKIRARLREGFSVAHLRLASRGAWANRWMRGDNDRETDYTFPRTIFRDADCLERHIRHARLHLPVEPWWPAQEPGGALPAPTTRQDDLRIRAADSQRLFGGGL
jgi:hypothetical protein